jgi:hypothetical protein
MELATPQIHAGPGNSYFVTHGQDADLYVEFSNEPVHMSAESARQGRPVFKDVPHITILFPGDKTKKVVRPVRMTPDESAPYAPDPERFPRQWAQFKNNDEQTQSGMPIDQWPPLTKSQVLELKAMKIFTVEQLAAVTDNGLDTLGLGARELRGLAKSWLDSAQGNKELSRLNSELAERDRQIKELTQRVNEITALVGAKKGKE